MAGTNWLRGWGVALLAVFMTACATSMPTLPAGGPLSRLPDTNPATNTGEIRNAGSQTIQEAGDENRLEEQIIYGSGQRVRPGSLSADTLPGGAYTVNFADARVDEAARTIFGDLLDEPYSIDPRVQGRVTVNTPRPLSREGLLALFEASLSVNNAALVLADGVYRVMPAGEAQTSGLARVAGANQPGWGVTAVPLQFVSANELRTLMESVVTRPGALRADAARNMLLIVGSAPERRNAAAAAQAFDVDWMAGMSVALIPLSNANAEDVIEEVRTIYSASSDGASGALRLQDVERLNAILAIAPSRALLDQARQWVARLDTGGADGSTLRTYFLENGEAEETAALLSELLGDGAMGGVAPDLESGTASSSGSSGRGGGGIRVIADTINNAILVLADPAGQALVERALEAIDRTPSQVVIEAVIAEVTLNDTLRYGVQFFFEGDGVDGVGDSVRGGFGVDGFDADGNFPGFNVLLETGGTARVALDALSSVTDLTVVSSPTVLVRDNATANFQVGDEVPIVTRQSNSVVNPDSPVVNSVEFRDTGVLLTVTPRVSSTGMVTLEIEQEVSNVASGTASTLTPTISTRSLSTTVSIRSGQTVILGGLIDESRNQVRDGIPGLASVPVLGDIFSQTSTTTSRTELLIFLTPRVINSDEEAAAVTNEIRRRMELLAPESN
ncbi:type II secretion system secretin GspD [Hyphobacterium sp. HN65]|uniref:Type II secretion system secretin GspD n=1 Tax=Hyphobacterium lacteum TaxID=3116575 RepID=A0ABU7LPJ8_9PROT|nr:type II secretion system secretin GspD [Hyphobacterium sp. HN65]MEE2525556.1 type II secretion system secretin GspD [Hyphobacterium sp. HN65]